MILFRGNRRLHAYNKNIHRAHFSHRSRAYFSTIDRIFYDPFSCSSLTLPNQARTLFGARDVPPNSTEIYFPISPMPPGYSFSDSNSFSDSHLRFQFLLLVLLAIFLRFRFFLSDSDSHMYFVNPPTAQVMMDTPWVVPVMTQSNRCGETPFLPSVQPNAVY